MLPLCSLAYSVLLCIEMSLIFYNILCSHAIMQLVLFYWPFLHVSNHEYYGDNFISKPKSNPNPRYEVSIISHQY